MTDQDTTNTAGEAGTRQRAIEAYEGARDRAADTLGEAPLIALAGGIAAGALIAALLPAHRSRDRAVRPTARRVKDSARAAFDAAQGQRDARLDELGLSREKGEDTIRSLLDGVGDAAQGLGKCRARCRAQVKKLTPTRKSASERGMSKLHLVFGGRVKDPRGLDFDLDTIDLVGIYDSYAAAEDAWRGAPSARSTTPR